MSAKTAQLHYLEQAHLEPCIHACALLNGNGLKRSMIQITLSSAVNAGAQWLKTTSAQPCLSFM